MSSKLPRPSQKKTPPKEQSYRLCTHFVIVFLSTTIVLTSYFTYKLFNQTVEMPKLNLDEWWGPYPIDPNPDVSIRPFEIEFSDVMINDLRERLLHTRPMTPPLENAGFTYGFNTNFLTRVLDYWKNKYNFKEREAFLNKYEHFKTKIQGLDLHFMRVKPEVKDGVTVLPLLMLHGWPGSFREFYEIAPMLSTSRPGYQFVFELIVPSLPGFGYSQGAARPGLGPMEMAVVMHNLMNRLGFQHYYIQGGDAGHTVGMNMATLFPDNVKGLHTNTPALFHRMGGIVNVIGSIWPRLVVEAGLEERMFPLTDRLMFTLEESGYFHIQATKPDTIGIALTDSPAGLAAYILEKFSTWTNPKYRQAGDGNLLAKYTLTNLLDNVMIYWDTNSITTSVRLYAETVRNFERSIDEIPTPVPTACIKFRHDIVFLPDVVLAMKFKNYLQSTVVEDGGHFPAMEVPAILADDVFKAVGKFLQFHEKDKKLVSAQQKTSDDAKTNESDNIETKEDTKPKTIYEFTVKDINGKEVKLDKYKGHVTIIVNVASQCGLTDTNYKELNELYEKYSSTKGLRILAFPCNQFGGQEPGNPQDIFKFTKDKGVKFDLFEKVEVNGENAHPLWKFLKESQQGMLGNFIKWNFSKFIIDKNGVPVERLAPTVNPLEMVPYLEKYW